MICAFFFCVSDATRLHDLLTFIGQLGGCKGHSALLVADAATPFLECAKAKQLALKSFDEVRCISNGESQTGWPAGPNSLFYAASAYIQAHWPQPWLLMETDAVPLVAGWLDAIAKEYKGCEGFMGDFYTGTLSKTGTSVQCLSGIAVYPPNAHSLMAKTNEPWDMANRKLMLEKGLPTPLIQHIYGQMNLPPTFASTKSTTSAKNTFTLADLRPQAVVFHRNKDGSLMRLLRQKLGYKVAPEMTPTPGAIFLPNVTLWAASWSDDLNMLARTCRVLRYCRRIMQCAKTVLFSHHAPPATNGEFDVVRIPKLDWQTWSIFVNRVVPSKIHTDFALSVHEDGFPMDITRWNPEFLRYDYIGAPWKDGVVGNGGFNIESRKLMDLKLTIPFDSDELTTTSDMFICRNRHKWLEDRGVRFAPRDLALTFSTEEFGQQWPSFGYHGRALQPAKHAAAWKNLEQAKL